MRTKHLFTLVLVLIFIISILSSCKSQGDKIIDTITYKEWHSVNKNSYHYEIIWYFEPDWKLTAYYIDTVRKNELYDTVNIEGDLYYYITDEVEYYIDEAGFLYIQYHQFRFTRVDRNNLEFVHTETNEAYMFEKENKFLKYLL